MGWKLLIQLAGEFFSRWLEKLNLKKQGAAEQREQDREADNEKLRKALDVRDKFRTRPPNDYGVRDEDYRD